MSWRRFGHKPSKSLAPGTTLTERIENVEQQFFLAAGFDADEVRPKREPLSVEPMARNAAEQIDGLAVGGVAVQLERGQKPLNHRLPLADGALTEQLRGARAETYVGVGAKKLNLCG